MARVRCQIENDKLSCNISFCLASLARFPRQERRVRSGERAKYESRTSYNQEPGSRRRLCRCTMSRWKKICVHPIGQCFTLVDRKKAFESRNFLVLRPVLLKFNISAQLIENFLNGYGSCNSAEDKLSISLESHNFLETRNFLVFLPAELTICLNCQFLWR